MIRDILLGEHCPSCHISALHPEGQTDRIAIDEIVTTDNHGTPFRVVRNWLQCGTCGSVWVIPTWADALNPAQLASWLRSHPVQVLPKDCPR